MIFSLFCRILHQFWASELPEILIYLYTVYYTVYSMEVPAVTVASETSRFKRKSLISQAFLWADDHSSDIEIINKDIKDAIKKEKRNKRRCSTFPCRALALSRIRQRNRTPKSHSTSTANTKLGTNKIYTRINMRKDQKDQEIFSKSCLSIFI